MSASARVTLAALVLWAWLGPAWLGADEPDAVSLEPGIRVERVGDWTRLEARVPGQLVSYALPRGERRRREVVLLVRPIDEADLAGSDDDDPDDESTDDRRLPACPVEPGDDSGRLELYLLDRGDDPGFTLLNDRIPGDVSAVDSADVDGDGRDELLLIREGELLLIDTERASEPTTALRHPGLLWRALHPRSVRIPELDGWAAVRTERFGMLGVHGPGEDGEWKQLAEVEMPVDVSSTRQGLRINSIVPRFVGRRSDGTLMFATRAEAHGTQRLETTLYEFPPGGEARLTESWARFPGSERLIEQDFIVLDDRPVLMVTTQVAGKLALFGEKLLRMYPVERDKSRLGRNPSLAIETRMNLWQEGTPLVADANADGREDLVIGYWKGLKDSRVVLDVYLRGEDGSFDDKPRTTSFNVKDGDRSFVEYGHDLDGDGWRDLLLRDESGSLLLFPGRRSTNGKKLVSSTALEVPLGKKEEIGEPVVAMVQAGDAPTFSVMPRGLPRFADLDGDGNTEMLIVDRGSARKPGELRILWPVSDGP